MGAKGGCGVTSLVTQLGALLANSLSKKTLVVDLHPDFGDAEWHRVDTAVNFYLPDNKREVQATAYWLLPTREAG